MGVWFSIDVTWKFSLKTNQGHGKLEFMDLPHGILFFQGMLGILHPPPCMDIKKNSPILYGKSLYYGTPNTSEVTSSFVDNQKFVLTIRNLCYQLQLHC